MSDIESVMEFLQNNRIQILSTSIDNKPISRPIGSAMLFKDKIWYCMNNDKSMFYQLQKNPNVCICVCSPEYNWIRIHAKVIFSDDIEVKQIYVDRPTSSFKSVDDERLSIFYLSEISAQIHIKGDIQLYNISY